MNTKINIFLLEIIEVCKKHGFSISHEDSGGSFLIEKFNEIDTKWLMKADNKTKN